MDNSKDNIGGIKGGIEYPERRFGVVAMEKGYITADQLWEGLVRQGDQSSPTAEGMPLGMILKEMGYLSAAQISEILDELETETQPGEDVPDLPGT